MVAARSGIDEASLLRPLPLPARESRALDWPELEAALPDGGLPHGVVELTAPRALGGATTIATSAIKAAQERDARAFCAWIDPEATLYAPGLFARGVDLARLFVVRPSRSELARVALKCVASCAFDVVAIDLDPVGAPGTRKKNDALFVRKLALAAEKAGATILLITDARTKKWIPWPVALRLELEREPGALHLRVGKDRHGRAGLAKARVRMEILHE